MATRPSTGVAQRFEDEGEALDPAVADDEAIGIDGKAPGPSDIAGQGLAQDGQTPGIAVVEVGVVGASRKARRRAATQSPAGKARQIAASGAEVVAGQAGAGRAPWSAGRDAGLVGGGRGRCHPGARALPGHQPALGRQLVVGVGDRSPGQAQIGGQGPGRRQTGLRPAADPTGWPPAGPPPARSGVRRDRRGRGAGPVPQKWTLQNPSKWTIVLIHLSRIIGSWTASPRPPSEFARVRRLPDRAAYDTATIHAILDAAMIGHVGVLREGRPVVIPMLFGRIEDDLYLHGSVASQLLRGLAGGIDVCFTTTLIDGLVYARSAFHHSMNYRSVVIVGTATPVEGDEKMAALRAIVDHITPGRLDEARPPSDLELRQTSVLRMPIDEASAKIRAGGPADEDEDLGPADLGRPGAGDPALRRPRRGRRPAGRDRRVTGRGPTGRGGGAAS